MPTAYKVLGQQPATTKVPTYAYISNKALTSNLATLTTAAVHGITQVGTIVVVVGVDSTFDGTYVIHSIPTTTSFTYVKTSANVTSAAVSPNGTATFIPVSSGVLVTNKQIQSNVAFITATSHGLSIGDYVAITIGDTLYDTLQAKVIGIPTANIFCYSVSTASAASTVVSQGAFGRTTYSADLDTVPSATSVVASTIYVVNRDTSTQYYLISIRVAGAALANQYLAFHAPLEAGATVTWTTGLTLAATDVITVQASSNLVNFTLTGSEIS